ncbi:hypothetical protein [Streptomyces sp. NPDC002676]
MTMSGRSVPTVGLPHAAELTAAADHVRTFATVMTNREGGRLRHWIADVSADEQAGLVGFAAGLLPDLDAVVHGMSTDWSSGPVEGRVNDLKALERRMFGRAKPPLLRKRLLLTAASRRRHGQTPDDARGSGCRHA